MAEKDKTAMYLIAIVGIVGAVGLVVLILNAGGGVSGVAEQLEGDEISEDLTGQVSRARCASQCRDYAREHNCESGYSSGRYGGTCYCRC